MGGKGKSVGGGKQICSFLFKNHLIKLIHTEFNFKIK